MEARLSQHICFKTTKREASPDLQHKDLDSRTEDEERASEMLLGNEEWSSCVLTPPTLKPGAPGKMFLFLPKMDNRSRLTSTPNQEKPRVESCFSNYSDEAFNFSLTGSGFEGRMNSPCSDKEEDVESIRSVLFPANQSKDAKQNQEVAALSGKTNPEKRSKRSKSPCAAKNLPHTTEQEFCQKLDVPQAIRKQGSKVQPFQDSGIGSFVKDDCSQVGENSLPSSPLKRKAWGDKSMTSLESPMKRLAFMSYDSSFNEDCSTIDLSRPGSSFLSDRYSPSKSDSVNDAILPPPIFANSIPFKSPKSDSCSVVANTNLIQQNESSPAKEFLFAKPSVRPVRARERPKKTFMIPTLTAMPESHAGKRHFDIVEGLAEKNLDHVIAMIFKGIREKDVLRCSRVSQSWARICEENLFTRATIKTLKKNYRKEEVNRGPENFNAEDAIKSALLKSPAKLGPVREFSSGRSALGNLQARARRTPTKTMSLPKTPSGKNHFVPADNRYDHHQGVKRSLSFGETTVSCPWCHWTAKVYGGNDYKGQCYRVECQHTFCTLCKMNYHFPQPCKTKTSTPPKDEPETVKAGSKKSKARLKKRLLL